MVNKDDKWVEHVSLCVCDSSHLHIETCAGPMCPTLQSLMRSQRRAQVPFCVSAAARPRCHKPLGRCGLCNSAAAKRGVSSSALFCWRLVIKTHNGWCLTTQTTASKELSRAGFQTSGNQDHVGSVGKSAKDIVFSLQKGRKHNLRFSAVAGVCTAHSQPAHTTLCVVLFESRSFVKHKGSVSIFWLMIHRLYPWECLRWTKPALRAVYTCTHVHDG